MTGLSPCGLRRECPPSCSCRSPGRSLSPPGAASGGRGRRAGVPAPASRGAEGSRARPGLHVGARRGCRGAVESFCSPALRARPDHALGQPWGEEGAGGGRSPGRWNRFKIGTLLPPLSTPPPAPGRGVPLRAGTRGSGPGELWEARRAVRVRPRLPGARGRGAHLGSGELWSVMGKTGLGIPGLAFASAAGSGRISLLSAS